MGAPLVSEGRGQGGGGSSWHNKAAGGAQTATGARSAGHSRVAHSRTWHEEHHKQGHDDDPGSKEYEDVLLQQLSAGADEGLEVSNDNAVSMGRGKGAASEPGGVPVRRVERRRGIPSLRTA